MPHPSIYRRSQTVHLTIECHLKSPPPRAVCVKFLTGKRSSPTFPYTLYGWQSLVQPLPVGHTSKLNNWPLAQELKSLIIAYDHTPLPRFPMTARSILPTLDNSSQQVPGLPSPNNTSPTSGSPVIGSGDCQRYQR